MNSLASWYWRTKACGQETLREHMPERLRRQDSVAVRGVKKVGRALFAGNHAA